MKNQLAPLVEQPLAALRQKSARPATAMAGRSRPGPGKALHAYYNAHPLLTDEPGLPDARGNLTLTTRRQVLHNGLVLPGAAAPQSM